MTRPVASSASSPAPSPDASAAARPSRGILQTIAAAKLKTPAKLGPIGQAARSLTVEAIKSRSLYLGAESVIGAGTQYAKKLIDQAANGDATGKGKGKDAGDGSNPTASINGLSAEDLRSIIESGRGLKNAFERRKFLKDVYAQLSGKLPENRALAEQLSGWNNSPGYNQLFGYKITNNGGQPTIETGPTRMHLIEARLKVIQQLRDQLSAAQSGADPAAAADADADADPLKDAHPHLLREEAQLKSEAKLIQTLLVNLEKSANTSGFRGFFRAMFCQSGVKWSKDTQQTFAYAVKNDVGRFLADRNWFVQTEIMLGFAVPSELPPAEDGQEVAQASLIEFHNRAIAGNTLPTLRRIEAALNAKLKTEPKTAAETKQRIEHLQGVIAQQESDVCKLLSKELEKNAYLGDLGVEGEHNSDMYTQVARFFVQHLPDYNRIDQQFGLRT